MLKKGTKCCMQTSTRNVTGGEKRTTDVGAARETTAVEERRVSQRGPRRRSTGPVPRRGLRWVKGPAGPPHFAPYLCVVHVVRWNVLPPVYFVAPLGKSSAGVAGGGSRAGAAESDPQRPGDSPRPPGEAVRPTGSAGDTGRCAMGDVE
eukprot:EG_transcript_42714